MKKNKLTYILAIILYAFGFIATAQVKAEFLPDYKASLQTMISSGSDMPFWMTANQNGIYSKHNSAYQLSQLSFRRNIDRDSLKNWGYTYGTSMVYAYAGSSDFQANEYWFGVRFRSIILKAGATSEPVLYNGLSSTNGNMYNSGNARPVPGLSLSSNGYIPFFIAKKWFSIKFNYEEGLLKDKRYVSDAHLHHKNLYLKGILSPSLSLEIGIEHYVFWGGHSPTYGQLPGKNEYLRYIFGLAGGSSATLNDQMNAAGNQLGSYNLKLKKEWQNTSATFYWNHPFEDRSGMELDNLRDGLWGIHLVSKNKNAFITDILYEYMYTLNQSGSYHMRPAPTPDNPDRLTGRGRDNYFNHGIYPSGFTHYQQMIGSPLFVPVTGADGISSGFASNRMWMHHLGFSGRFGSGFFWKTITTWSRNFGTYGAVYPDPLDEFSFLAECRYEGEKLPFKVKAGIAGDYGSRFEKRSGSYLGVEINF